MGRRRHMGQRMGLQRMDRHKRCRHMDQRLELLNLCRCCRHKRQATSFRLRELLYVGNSY